MTAYRVPARVAHVVPDGQPELPSALFLMRLPDGEPLVLHGSGAWIWLLAAEGECDVAGAIADATGQDRQELISDVQAFLVDLVNRGLLEVDEAPLGPASSVTQG